MSVPMSRASAPDPKAQDPTGVGPFERLLALVEDDLARVTLLIRDRMSSDHAPRIPEISAHLIEAGGKRLRPILTLAAAPALRLPGHGSCETGHHGGIHPHRNAAA